MRGDGESEASPLDPATIEQISPTAVDAIPLKTPKKKKKRKQNIRRGEEEGLA